MSPESLLHRLRITRGDGVTSAQRKQMEHAGYDLDVIVADNGLSAERLHDAAFMNEEIARATLGGNYERLVGSIGSCCSVVRKLAPLRVADLGGACGIVCFGAAMESPTREFVIIDRSSNALAIGRRWAQRLRIENMLFVRRDFSDSTLPALRDTFDLVLLEYVLDLAGDHTQEELAIAEMTPASRAASEILRLEGILQVRFGDFNELGVTALIRSAFRNHLFVESVSASAIGCAITFAKKADLHRSEDTEALTAFENLALQAYDAGD